MLNRLTLAGVLVLAAVSQAGGGDYSAGSNDPANQYDPPVEKTDPRIVEWADTVVEYGYRPAPGVGVYVDWETGEPMPEVGFANPTTGIGSLGDLYDPDDAPPAEQIPPSSGATEPFSGDVTDTDDEYGFIGYDDPGSITVGFPHGIRNGPGPDFAVFENAFYYNGVVADLAYVEVSTDEENFARFDAISLNTQYLYLDDTWGSGYASIDETNVYNLAGKHLDGWGTPFDLAELAGHSLVAGGQLDLDNIQYVRLVDIPGIGDGTYVDSLGNGIRDAWVTVGSGGYDFRLSEGVGVLHAVPEPGAVVLLVTAGLGFAVFAVRRRRR